MGGSGEQGCLQFKPDIYKAYSIEILGYAAPYTKINAQYVATMKVQKWLDSGKTKQQVLLAWNAGEGAKKCSKGVNSMKVKYNSCAYVENGMKLLAKS